MNEFKLICLHPRIAVVSTHLNDFNYYYRTLIILFDITHSSAHSYMVSSIAVSTGIILFTIDH